MAEIVEQRRTSDPFKCRQFDHEVIVLCLRCYTKGSFGKDG